MLDNVSDLIPIPQVLFADLVTNGILPTSDLETKDRGTANGK